MRSGHWKRLLGHRTAIGMLSVALMAGVACSDDGEQGEEPDELVDAGADALADAADVAPDAEAPDTQASCDPLQPEVCAYPWPSNLFLAPDESRETGYTLSFGEETLPIVDSGANAGTKTSPQPYRRLDGYGVGQPIMVLFPDVDTAGMPAERNIARSVEDGSPTVLLEVDANGNVVRRVPHFAELDLRAESPEQQTLFLRPAVILEESTRYVVALRGLTDTSGNPIEPSQAFAALRDGTAEGELADRQALFDDIFGILQSEGIDKSELTLAWDFRTASSQALHGRMLHMRDKGLQITGEDGPELVFESFEEFSEEENSKWWIEAKGTFESPRFMKDVEIHGRTGPVFNLGERGLPAQNGLHEQTFWLRVPHSARDGSPHGLIQYGHGLLGTGEQVDGGFNAQIANDHKFIFFATSLTGMSREDLEIATFALLNLNGFPFMADRLHQGMLEFLLLARSMRERLPLMEEMTTRNINVNTDELYYSGISQGGIFGATYMALSTDVTYGHLGVPGNNYSMLLHRSVDFNPYLFVMKRSYSMPVTRAVALATIQLLWGQTDPVSYLRHITDEPFDGNDPHYVLLAPAKGDYQVSPLTNEIAARSDIGIKVMENYGRDLDLIEPEAYPYTGSGIVLYDFGNPWPVAGNIPPSDELGDPHELPRRQEYHNRQMVHFFRNGGEIIDVCGGDGCTPD